MEEGGEVKKKSKVIKIKGEIKMAKQCNKREATEQKKGVQKKRVAGAEKQSWDVHENQSGGRREEEQRGHRK